MRVIFLVLTAVNLLFGALTFYTRDAATNTVYDGSTDLTWQDDASVSGINNQKNWSDAIDYCEALDFAGAQDWRLPNFNELYMIADRSIFNPAMHMNAINGFVNVGSSDYWSSTTVSSDTSSAWVVGFNDGVDNWDYKPNDNSVRCVRGGQATPLTFPLPPAIMYYLLQ